MILTEEKDGVNGWEILELALLVLSACLML